MGKLEREILFMILLNGLIKRMVELYENLFHKTEYAFLDLML